MSRSVESFPALIRKVALGFASAVLSFCLLSIMTAQPQAAPIGAAANACVPWGGFQGVYYDCQWLLRPDGTRVEPEVCACKVSGSAQGGPMSLANFDPAPVDCLINGGVIATIGGRDLCLAGKNLKKSGVTFSPSKEIHQCIGKGMGVARMNGTWSCVSFPGKFLESVKAQSATSAKQ